MGALDDEQVFSKSPQACVHINRQNLLCGEQALAKECVVLFRSFFQLLPAVEQTLGIFILTAADRLYQRTQTKSTDHERGLHEEEIVVGLRLWTQKGIHVCIVWRTPGVLAVQE